jgi:hydroxymethylpyrimidine pyrophosphatase-like HAD family hydrolase
MSLSPGKPVLVFDLDETLIASEKVYDTTIFAYRLTGIKVNEKLLEIIHTAKGRGWQVLLLTNNENAKVIFHGEERRFVDVSLAEITRAYTEKYGQVDHLFDKILTAERGRNSINNSNSVKRTYLKKRIDIHYKDKNGQNRIRYYAKPVKSLQDVRNMLGYPVEASDVYFFDDDNEHQLCHESKFIHITPPFSGKGDDATDYHLLNAKGGKRTRRRRGRRGSKGSRRKLKELRHGM